MKTLALHPEYQLYERKGKPFCSSLQVAETFNRDHKNVLATIKKAIDTTQKLAANFSAANFIESSYKDRGKVYPEYLLTRDGFTFVTMGFNGLKAAAFKISYIQRFNDMETFIAELYAAKSEFPQFTEAVMMAHDEPKSYHYSNECDMINRIVLGQSAKQFRESRGLATGQSIRPYLTEIQISDIHALQLADIGLLATGVQSQERKAALAEYHNRRKIIKLSA
jgi:Rha family phage regulatory protein